MVIHESFYFSWLVQKHFGHFEFFCDCQVKAKLDLGFMKIRWKNFAGQICAQMCSQSGPILGSKEFFISQKIMLIFAQ
jgi:hypothetical protein